MLRKLISLKYLLRLTPDKDVTGHLFFIITIHIMPALLLQKPSKTLKSKDHVVALERRFGNKEKRRFDKAVR